MKWKMSDKDKMTYHLKSINERAEEPMKRETIGLKPAKGFTFKPYELKDTVIEFKVEYRTKTNTHNINLSEIVEFQTNYWDSKTSDSITISGQQVEIINALIDRLRMNHGQDSLGDIQQRAWANKLDEIVQNSITF